MESDSGQVHRESLKLRGSKNMEKNSGKPASTLNSRSQGRNLKLEVYLR